MMNSHEEDAARLAELLAKKEECHDASLHPFAEVANALISEIPASTATLNPGVAATQRAQLISMTTPASSPSPSSVEPASVPSVVTSAPPVSVPPSPAPRRPRWSWFMAGGFVAAGLAAVIIWNLPRTLNPMQTAPIQSPESIARLMIPAAHAADAFSITAESSDPGGADTSTSFLVTSAVPVTSEILGTYLQIIPPPSLESGTPTSVHFSVAAVSEGKFRITPAEPLQGGAVYRLALAAAVERPDGAIERRDFSWAIQTKQIFRVVSSIPGNQSSGVPVNSVVEFAVSMPGFGDPASFFSIIPAVPGRFQARGRSVVFIPAKTLTYGQIYHVTLKSGFGIANSTQTLPQDVTIEFETESVQVAGPQKIEIKPFSDFVETVPDRELILPVYNKGVGEDTASFHVQGYHLSDAVAKDFLREYGKQPPYATALRARGDLFSSRATEPSFTVDGKVEKKNEYALFIRLPGVRAGRYAVKIESKDGVVSWFYLQSTKVATYFMSDAKQTLVWAVNADTSRPLSALDVRTDLTTVKTDDQGIAKFPTSATIQSTSTEAVEIIEVGSGELSSFVLIASARRVRPYWGYWGSPTNVDTTVSYLYVERPLYHPTDSAHIFGLAQDRASGKGVGTVTAELIRSGFFEPFDPATPKVYRRVEISTDEAGVFQGEISWADLAPGWYTVRLQRNGVTIASRNAEIRNFVKPAYTIDVSTVRQAVYAGEFIEGEVRVAFFDGTPVAGMDLMLDAQDGRSGMGIVSTPLTTDAAGHAIFRVPTQTWSCEPLAKDSYCASMSNMSLVVHPQDAEEAEINGSSFVNIWHSHASLSVESAVTGTRGLITFTARKVDLSQAEKGGWSDKVLGEPLRNTQVTGQIFEREWIQTQTGTSYDPIEKLTQPVYSYDLKETSVATIAITTDAEGKARLPFEMKPKVAYRVVGIVKDEKGIEESATTYTGAGWWSVYRYERPLTLEDMAPQPDRVGYHLGEQIHLGFTENGNAAAESPEKTYLFVEAHIGIARAKSSNAPMYDLTFGEEHVPNTTIYGIAWTREGFIEQSFNASLDSRDRELRISVTPDAAQYAPGAKAKVHVTVQSKDGSSVANTKVALGVVDEALFATAYDAGDERPTDALYTWVTDGIIFTQRSHLDPAAFAGGAEKGGGGGGDGVRKSFKDTAAFVVVTVDQNGETDAEFSLPDNLTSWRVSASAVNGQRYGGGARTNLRVTKPVFVDAVLPESVLTADKPLLKLRAYGTALPVGTPVTFTVDAPSLGLAKGMATGTAGTPVYVALPSLSPGDHVFTFRVTSDKGTDAIERHLRIAPSRFMRNEAVAVDLVPQMTLPDIASSSEVTVSFIPKTRATALPRVEALTGTWSKRLEARVADRLAQDMLRQFFGRTIEKDDASLLSYQQSDGGLSLLTYGSSDVRVSALVATANSNLFDRTLLSNYFWAIVLNKDVSREEQLAALSGLAALQEPVLSELHLATNVPDLSPAERLLVIRGLFVIGDAETARAMFDELLKVGEEHDGKMMLRIAKEQSLNVAATSEAASMAAMLHHPSAEKLMAYVENSWTNDVLTNLDQAMYLMRTIPLLFPGVAEVTYASEGQEFTVELGDDRIVERTFTAAEWKQLRITRVEGPVALSFERRTTSVPAQSSDISIRRTYIKPDGTAVNALVEGDTLVVRLEVTWKNAAPSGCYTLRDHTPAGFAPLTNIWWNGGSGDIYLMDRDAESVTYIACRPPTADGSTQDIVRSTSYRARIVARGTYVGEPAVLQSMNMPSVAAVSTYGLITVQ